MRPAWYARRPGRWRDLVSILHLPYTTWHLSYVLVGAGLATHVNLERLVATVLAFALAVGVGAHALDELHGRPLGTSIPSWHLVGMAVVSILGAVILGVLGEFRIGWGLVPFIVVGVALLVSYNLELFQGRLHNDAVFAFAWGAFPLLTSYYAQAETVRLAAVIGAFFAFGLSWTQRSLSTEARELRRRVTKVEGVITFVDGRTRAVTRESLLVPLETSLRALSWTSFALGVALVLSGTGH